VSRGKSRNRGGEPAAVSNVKKSPLAAEPAAHDRSSSLSALAFEISQSSGPLPAPEVLAEYGKIIPGGAERLVSWVEQQSSHRQAIETKRINADIANDARGQWFALVVTLATIGSGTWLIWVGKDISGLAVVLGELATLAGVFVFNKNAKTKELQQKIAALLGRRSDPG